MTDSVSVEQLLYITTESSLSVRVSDSGSLTLATEAAEPGLEQCQLPNDTAVQYSSQQTAAEFAAEIVDEFLAE